MASKPAAAVTAAATPVITPAASTSTPTTATTPAAATNTTATPAAATTSATDGKTASGEDALETRWSFYFDKKLSREAQAALDKEKAAGTTLSTYASNLQKVGTFDSIQGFWRHYAFMQKPDALPRDYNMYLFREELLPAWETFPQGGCWTIKVRKGNGVIGRLWEELCFACVGEWFEDNDVVGVSLATRVKDDNISVWTAGVRGTEINVRIGERLKDLLNLDESTICEYKSFRQAMADNSSFRGARQFQFVPAPAQ